MTKFVQATHDFACILTWLVSQNVSRSVSLSRLGHRTVQCVHSHLDSGVR